MTLRVLLIIRVLLILTTMVLMMLSTGLIMTLVFSFGTIWQMVSLLDYLDEGEK